MSPRIFCIAGLAPMRPDNPLRSASSADSVANVSSAGALDVYLTDATTDLDDTTPVLSGVSAALAQVSADSGTFRLRVTASGDTSDVRLDIPNFTLADRGVGSLILTSTQGGMLANGIFLPQQGQPTKFANTKARVRGAVALANGAAATIQLNGQTILTSATAGVIASRYTLFESGSLPVSLTVNGTQVTLPNLTMVYGAEKTFLICSNNTGPQARLIVDHNPLPTCGSTKTKMRL